jgi:hypothetical protein
MKPKRDLTDMQRGYGSASASRLPLEPSSFCHDIVW